MDGGNYYYYYSQMLLLSYHGQSTVVTSLSRHHRTHKDRNCSGVYSCMHTFIHHSFTVAVCMVTCQSITQFRYIPYSISPQALIILATGIYSYIVSCLGIAYGIFCYRGACVPLPVPVTAAVTSSRCVADATGVDKTG